jgi:stage II sporulation protein AB (anti-sigma F factor)
VAEFAIAAGVAARQVEAVRLASSEAFTNAVLHAYGDQPGRIDVTAAIVAGEIWVLIADDGHGMQPRSDRPGLGFGLGLIAQLADDLAIVPRASGGTEVRMRFNFVTAAASEAPDRETPAHYSPTGPHGSLAQSP